MEPQDARVSLEVIEQASALARRAIAHAGTGYFFLVWGFVWMAGFLGNELLAPAAAGYLWLALDVFGVVASILVGTRFNRRVRSAGGRRAGLRVLALWGVLVAYAVLLGWVAGPAPDRILVLVSLYVSLGYVIAGLWVSGPLLLAGLGIGLLTLLAWLLFPAYLGLSLAVIGGGGMMLMGLMMLRAWE